MTRQNHEAEVIANLQEIITLYDMSTVRDYRTDGREIWIDSAARDACEYAVKVMAENSAEPDKKLLMQALKMCEEKLQEYMHESEYKEFATTVAKMMFFAEVTASENDEFKRTVFEHWNEITAAADTDEEDCISRRDAINLFAHWAREGRGSFEDALMELPPVTERWIPTSERLPDDGEWCVFTDGKRMSIERFKTDAIDHFYPSGRWFELEDAKAWMPLPEMYREEDEG